MYKVISIKTILLISLFLGSISVSHADHTPKKMMRNFMAFSMLGQTGKLGQFNVNVAKFGELRKNEAPQVSSNKYDEFFADQNNLAAIVMKRGKIVYERYNSPINMTTPMLGMSMSKTAISASLGTLFCKKELSNLDDVTSIHSEFLRTTPYSNVTIRNVLQMNSGVSSIGRSDEKRFNQKSRGMQKFEGEASVREALDFYENAAREQGSQFNYHSSDSLALSVLVEEIAGMPLSKFFFENVYSNFGQNNYMHWTSDASGTTAAFSDLVMTARDWANFGQFLMTQKLNKTCLGEFFNEGVRVAVDTGKSNKSKYGYQSWVFDVNNTPTLVLQGHGGQFMVLDEQNETILLILSKNENYQKGNLFKDIANFAERLN
jgi:CubicO group peptidase (beta-lactamase class C family)